MANNSGVVRKNGKGSSPINTKEENQKMGPRNLPKNVHIEACGDVERPTSHFVVLDYYLSHFF